MSRIFIYFSEIFIYIVDVGVRIADARVRIAGPRGHVAGIRVYIQDVHVCFTGVFACSHGVVWRLASSVSSFFTLVATKILTICNPISLQKRMSLSILCTIFMIFLAEDVQKSLSLQYQNDITVIRDY